MRGRRKSEKVGDDGGEGMGVKKLAMVTTVNPILSDHANNVHQNQ